MDSLNVFQDKVQHVPARHGTNSDQSLKNVSTFDASDAADERRVKLKYNITEVVDADQTGLLDPGLLVALSPY